MNSFFVHLSVLVCVMCITAQQSKLASEFITQSFTDSDFLSWTFTGASIPATHQFTTCNGNLLFGGYNMFIGDSSNPNSITKTWAGLVSHYATQLSVTIYKIDSWIGNTLFIMLDGTTVQTYTFDATNGGTNDLCGNPTPIPDALNSNFNEVVVNMNITITHSASTLTLKMISNLNNGMGSWGIRNLNIVLLTCAASCLTCTNASICTGCDTAQGLALVGASCTCTAPALLQKISKCAAAPCALCVGACDTGYYYDTTIGDCEPCNVACATCNSPQNTPATCFTCATGYYRVNNALPCSSCSLGCSSCNGLTSSSCTACSTGYFLSTTQCLSACPPGFYGQESTKICFPCIAPCQTCNGNSILYCLSCLVPFYYLNYQCYNACPAPYYTYQQNCVTACPSSTYNDPATLMCLPCIASCTYCNSSTTCLVCNTGTYMLTSVCYVTCPNSYYGSTTTGQCVSCSSECLTCNGPNRDNCQSCSYPAVLVNSICYLTCPTNTYSMLCLPCDTNCLTCSGSSSTDCLTCNSNVFLNVNQSTCVSACTAGQLIDNIAMSCTSCATGEVSHFNIYVSCSPTCLTCDDNTFLSCLSCASAARLVGKTCQSLAVPSTVYSPNLSSTSLGSLILFILLAHFGLGIFIEITCKYKSVLLATIQLFQMLSYTYYLAIEMSQSTQNTLFWMYRTNIGALVQPIVIPSMPNLSSKFLLINKSGYYLVDTFFAQLILLGCALFFFAVSKLRYRSHFCLAMFKKINPYLMSYVFRLLLLELLLSMMLYAANLQVSSVQGIGSLVLILVNLVLFMVGLCWKIRTQNDGKQFALLYDNEVGISDQHIQQGTRSLSSFIRQSQALPCLIIHFSKLPLPITIILFVENSETQTICLLVYSFLYATVNLLIPYHRRIYRWTIRFCSVILISNTIVCVLVSTGISDSYILQIIWLLAALVLLGVSIGQVLVNVEYFCNMLCLAKQQCFKLLDSESANDLEGSAQHLPNQSQVSILDSLQPKQSISKLQFSKPTLKPIWHPPVARQQPESNPIIISPSLPPLAPIAPSPSPQHSFVSYSGSAIPAHNAMDMSNQAASDNDVRQVILKQLHLRPKTLPRTVPAAKNTLSIKLDQGL